MPADDAIIARAFRWSVGVLVGLVLIVLTVFLIGRRGGANPTRLTALRAPQEARAEAAAAIPAARFEDVTRVAGIEFEHHNGATGDKLLPETMGSGVAFLDLDGDGDADPPFLNGASWPWTPPSERRAHTRRCIGMTAATSRMSRPDRAST